MELYIYIIIVGTWYMIGWITWIWYCVDTHDCVTIENIMKGVPIALLGIFLPLMILSFIFDSSDIKDKILWKRKTK